MSEEILKKFLFLGMSPQQIKVAWVVLYRLAILIGIGAGWGWFASVGVPRFAQASELEKTQSSIVQTLDKQAKKHDAAMMLLNQTLASNIASQIRQQALKRCKASSSGAREEHNREIDRLQDEFFTHSGKMYEIPSCENL